jgi:hypothetical protein
VGRRNLHDLLPFEWDDNIPEFEVLAAADEARRRCEAVLAAAGPASPAGPTLID